MTVGIIVAMDKEMALVCDAFSPIKDGGSAMGCLFRVVSAGSDATIVILQCGVGKVNAAVGAMLLRWHFHADVIVSTGVAGGTLPYIKQGMVVAGTSYSYHDVYCGAGVAYGTVQGEPSGYAADAKMLHILRESFHEVLFGMIVSGDQFIETKERMGRVLDYFPTAIAVDMESASIAQVCSKPLAGKTTPFISLRIISDCILNPEAKDYDGFWKAAPMESSKRTVAYIKKLIEEY